jgi:predicted S18 family serine protease
MGGKPMPITEEDTRNICVQKLSEAQERLQYVKLFFPEVALADITKDVTRALHNHQNGDYALCISKAMRAKAGTNVLLNMMTSTNEQFENLLHRKIEATKQVIVKQQEKDVFPILGYSYYEYASSLEDVDPLSAMIYTEYALEMAWLDIYFEDTSSRPVIYFNPSYMIMFFIGFILGVTTIVALLPRRNRFFRRSKHLRK